MQRSGSGRPEVAGGSCVDRGTASDRAKEVIKDQVRQLLCRGGRQWNISGSKIP
jgi:hypothetical protein